ncbi:MAG: ribokinase [Bacillus sp. (in: firmicutes)]
MSKIVVVGSISMDLVVTSSVRPEPGETVLGKSFQLVPGGKGANQAVAAARLGAEVSLIGCVGDDMYGPQLIKNLKENGVDTDFVKPVTGSSGTAHIMLVNGENSIVVVKAANDFVTPAFVGKAIEELKNADIVLIQQEIPAETVEYVCQVCGEFNIPLVLNPAPARHISRQAITQATYITPNEHEASKLFMGVKPGEAMATYPDKLIITEGSKGVRFHNGREEQLIPAFTVKAVDTTGAGDTFNAAFAVARAEGKTMEESLIFANQAAAFSVTKFGAQGGMPFRREMEGNHL